MSAQRDDHEALIELAGLYVLGALSAADRADFEVHLATCATCAAEVRSFEQIPPALAQLAPPAQPPADARQWILKAIQTAPPETRVWTPSVGRENFLFLATAASLALAIGLGAYAVRLRDRVSDLDLRLAQETLRAETSDRQAAQVRQVALDAQSSVSVLTAPDLARIDLAGQTVAPSAAGRAFWSRSRGLVFTASNLPALPAGRVYQLWVLTAQPAPISAGLLKPDATGRVTAVFNTPPDLPKPVAMAVTIEPDGGVPAPTGDKYLVGLAD